MNTIVTESPVSVGPLRIASVTAGGLREQAENKGGGQTLWRGNRPKADKSGQIGRFPATGREAPEGHGDRTGILPALGAGRGESVGAGNRPNPDKSGQNGRSDGVGRTIAVAAVGLAVTAP